MRASCRDDHNKQILLYYEIEMSFEMKSTHTHKMCLHLETNLQNSTFANLLSKIETSCPTSNYSAFESEKQKSKFSKLCIFPLAPFASIVRNYGLSTTLIPKKVLSMQRKEAQKGENQS